MRERHRCWFPRALREMTNGETPWERACLVTLTLIYMCKIIIVKRGYVLCKENKLRPSEIVFFKQFSNLYRAKKAFLLSLGVETYHLFGKVLLLSEVSED